jgi:hypothetical protein
MTLSAEREQTESRDDRVSPPSGARTLVLVAGSGRSGTSLFTGIMQRLGFHVPQPEVAADPTNPRGFAESKWVVDFHNELLEQAAVQVADARPAAWARTARVAHSDSVRRRLRSWLGGEFGKAENVIIKDPRLCWFVPLWRQCAEELGATARFATVLRHPAAVVDSKQRSYGNWQGDVERTAGWVNQALFTERATRDGVRIFVKYQDLLDDWTKEVARAGEVLDLALIREVSAATITQTYDFVDRSLSRSRDKWDDFEIPAGLRELADETWDLMGLLASDRAASAEVSDRLDAARAAYIKLYEEAEAIAHSSITAVHRQGGVRPSRLAGVLKRVPKRYRRRLPLRWRVVVMRKLSRGAAGGR